MVLRRENIVEADDFISQQTLQMFSRNCEDLQPIKIANLSDQKTSKQTLCSNLQKKSCNAVCYACEVNLFQTGRQKKKKKR